MTRIIIEAEVQEELSQATFLRMGRAGSSRKAPGYTITVDGSLEAIRDTIEEAESFATYYKDRVLEGAAVIFVR